MLRSYVGRIGLQSCDQDVVPVGLQALRVGATVSLLYYVRQEFNTGITNVVLLQHQVVLLGLHARRSRKLNHIQQAVDQGLEVLEYQLLSSSVTFINGHNRVLNVFESL